MSLTLLRLRCCPSPKPCHEQRHQGIHKLLRKARIVRELRRKSTPKPQNSRDDNAWLFRCDYINIHIIFTQLQRQNCLFRRTTAKNAAYLCPMGLTEILLAILLLGLGVAGIAIKILVKPGGEFSGTCASNNPILRDESGGCSVCGARPQDACQAEQN